jgi:hypothetical protein
MKKAQSLPEQGLFMIEGPEAGRVNGQGRGRARPCLPHTQTQLTVKLSADRSAKVEPVARVTSANREALVKSPDACST